MNRIQKVVIVGGGSAGFLAALTFRLRLPQLPVVVIHSPEIPVIGVGESTTRAVPLFLHQELKLDRDEFFRLVRPSWKLGLRLEWGDPADTHFNYPFDLGFDQRPPGLNRPMAYCMLADAADCSGFSSLLLGQTLGETFVRYDDTLFCDAAVIGSWQREDEVRPYTTAETMDHGWCWRIDFLDVVTRGYVFSTAFCTADEAMREMKQKNPQLGDDLRLIHFPRGRYENFWVGNVAAVGNSSGFVEPLEATALHLIVEQLHFLTLALSDAGCHIVPAMRDVENDRYRRLRDDVRDFLAVHYRFNRKLDTPFWRHCRAATDLGGAAALVEYFRQAGPSGLCNALLDPTSIFRYYGYLIMLIGQRVSTAAPLELAADQRQLWDAHREQVCNNATPALPMREALQQAYGDA